MMEIQQVGPMIQGMNRFIADAPNIPADFKANYNQTVMPYVNLLMTVLPLIASLPSAKASPSLGNHAGGQPALVPPTAPNQPPSTPVPLYDKGHPAHLNFYFSRVYTSPRTGERSKVFFQPKFEKERAGPWTWNKWVCRQYGAEMVTVHSSEENTFLTAWLESTAVGMEHPGAWLGARISNASPRFTWEGGAEGVYTNWKLGEPNEGGETCLHLGWAKPYDQWWNWHCHEKRMLIACQLYVDAPRTGVVDRGNTLVVTPVPATSTASPSSPFPQIDNLMLCVSGQLRAEDVAKVGFAYQFDILREGSSAVVAQYQLDLKNGKGSAGPGAHASPDVIFKLSDASFMQMFKGETDGITLFSNGKLKLEPLWAVNAAMKLEEVLKKSENDQRVSCA